MELLIVVALIALVMGLSAPALVEIARGQGMKRAIADVSGMVERGRAEAMAMSTWTWMGVKQQNSGGDQELLAVVVASKDGTTNMAGTNLRLISRPTRIKNAKILSDLTSWATADGTEPLSDGTFSFSQTIQGQSVTFSKTVLGFSPRGEATIDYNSVPPWIEIGLRETRGNTEIPEKTASIRVSGFSGQLNVDY